MYKRVAMPSARYQPSVRIGNWFEEICLELEIVKSFKSQRDSGQLLVEKTRQLFDNFHKSIELEAPKDTVCFGAVVQLMPVYVNICETADREVEPALSVIINERVVRKSQRINVDCEVTIAPSVRPCVRNSFRIVSADDEERRNETLLYTRPFRLQCVETQGEPLYLFSAPKLVNLSSVINATYQARKMGETNQPLGLIGLKDCGAGKMVPCGYLNWMCHHIDPKKRFETDGTPLPSNSPLVITHVSSNRNLAAENVVIQTLFGQEYLVSCQNYRNIFHREKWNNVWMICNGHQKKRRTPQVPPE